MLTTNNNKYYYNTAAGVIYDSDNRPTTDVMAPSNSQLVDYWKEVKSQPPPPVQLLKGKYYIRDNIDAYLDNAKACFVNIVTGELLDGYNTTDLMQTANA